MREPVHYVDFIVVLVIVGGVTLVSIFGPHGSSNVDMDHLDAYMLNPAFLAWASTMGGIVAIWMCIYCLVDLEFLNAIRPHPR